MDVARDWIVWVVGGRHATLDPLHIDGPHVRLVDGPEPRVSQIANRSDGRWTSDSNQFIKQATPCMRMHPSPLCGLGCVRAALPRAG